MSEKQPMARLKEEQRILGQTRMIRDPESATAEDMRAVVDAVIAFKNKNNLSWAYIARAIACGVGTLHDVITDRYKGNRLAVLVDLDRWLEDEAKREQAPKPTEFVATAVAEEIMAVADATITLKTIGLVYGPSGIGKTIALQAVAAEKPGSILISIESAAASGTGFVAALGKALRANSDGRSRSAWQTLEQIKEKLRGTPRLIIVDETHKLCGDGPAAEKALNIIRDLHDHTGVPILLSGTIDLVAYLDRRQATGREPMAQIRSRIGISRDLMERTTSGDGGPGEPLFSVEEIRKVFAKSKIRLAPDAARYMALLANVPDSGGLRSCRNLLVMATKVCDGRVEALTEANLRSVQKLLVNRRAFSLIESKIEQQQPAKPLAKAVPA